MQISPEVVDIKRLSVFQGYDTLTIPINQADGLFETGKYYHVLYWSYNPPGEKIVHIRAEGESTGQYVLRLL